MDENEFRKQLNLIQVYIHDFKKKGKVKKIGNKEIELKRKGKRTISTFSIYTITEKEPQKSINSDIKNHLKFLMDFFQDNAERLKKENKEFFIKNQSEFQSIANILEGGN